MDTMAGFIQLHRSLRKKFRGKPLALRWLWIEILMRANYDHFDSPKGTFDTTMSELSDALFVSSGNRREEVSNKVIGNHLRALADDGRISVLKVFRASEWWYRINVPNYDKYQSANTCGVQAGGDSGDDNPHVVPISINKEEEEKGPGTPLDRFRREVKSPILKILVDHADNGTMPKEFYSWFIKKTMGAGSFPKELSEKKAQPQFEAFVAHSKKINRKLNDWYAGWQDSILKYLRTDWLGPKDLSEFQANYNHGWEESHKGKFDGSQLPPEIGSVPDSWKP